MLESNDYQIHVLKTDCEENEYWKPRIYDSLKNGTGRFAWSYIENGDLHFLKDKIEKGGYESLSGDEKKCWSANFLLNIQKGDYLVYLNLPKWGLCTIAKVKDAYKWDKWDTDFNHAIPVEGETVREFDRNDKDVHPALSERLKLRGRWYRIYLRAEFEDLLVKLKKGILSGKHASRDDRLNLLVKDMEPFLENISKDMQFTHPKKRLEELVEYILRKIPNVCNVERKQGRADFGADIIFEYKTGIPFGGLQKLERCAVQVKSYEGDLDYKEALHDLRKAFNIDDSFTSGLIISTALKMTNEFAEELETLSNEFRKQIGVLIGKELAQWFIKYGM